MEELGVSVIERSQPKRELNRKAERKFKNGVYW